MCNESGLPGGEEMSKEGPLPAKSGSVSSKVGELLKKKGAV